jgi:hypothetical protein
MANPVWVTPAGSLGSYGATVAISPIQLEATPVSPATSVTYSLYGVGSLPLGLDLSSSGIISGTPTQDQIGSTAEFTVKVIDNYGNVNTRTFTITIIAQPPVWVTPSGVLGTYTAQYNIVPFDLEATPVLPSTTVTYKLVLGSLPSGLSISKTGQISGIPQSVKSDSISEFTISAIDNRGRATERAFSIEIVNPSPVWVTPAGTLGTFPAQNPILPAIALSATPVLPATSITYKLLSGTLPTGVKLSNAGIISGTPNETVSDKIYSFVVRATDNLGNIRDRGFTFTVTGNLVPTFVTPSGALFETQDSIWQEYKIQYNNPDPTNTVIITLVSGALPQGLEINEVGLIRGYPAPPTVDVNLTATSTIATATSSSGNIITCLTTSDFVVGRPIIFSGSILGGLTLGTTYYVKQILSSSTFTISQSVNGPVVLLNNDSGLMTCTLPQTTQGEPTVKIYSFTLKINSALGSQLRNFSIKVINQNAPVSQGGPGNLSGTREPVIYNTRPFTYNIDQDVSNYGFYVLPPAAEYGIGGTYPITTNAFIGTFYSDNYFAFRILGYDFDGDQIEYIYDQIPLGLQADTNTGWIRGTTVIAEDTVSVYNFSAAVKKKNSTIGSPFVNFSFILANNINGDITWITDSNLGSIYNGTPSIFQVRALSDVTLNYVIVDGSLPNNLQLLPNGEIVGTVAFETTDDYVAKNTEITYTFTVNAYSDISPTVITSTKTFTITVVQEFIKPTDTLYIECTPSIKDRILIDSLLNNTMLIPYDYLYRPDDINFGKAQNVTYVHAYGIYASSLNQYIEAIQKNHYWRNITLGPIKTAVARDSNGDIVYEVVYSEVIDNLVNDKIVTVYAGNFIPGKSYTIKYVGTTKWTEIGAPNSNIGTTFVATAVGSGTGSATTVTSSISVSEQVYWPFFIDLNLGPWYTSITDVYTSYIYPVELDLITQDALFYITTQENQNLATNQGQPTFYTSLTPGYARTLYPNSLENMRKRVEQNLGVDTNAALLPLWMTSQQADGNTLGFTPAWVIAYTKPGYATFIKSYIDTYWTDPAGNKLKLNLINFQIDKFTVNKSLTFDYDNTFTPPAWTDLPSGTPVPDPINSKDFNVLFSQKTILPTKTQYPR